MSATVTPTPPAENASAAVALARGGAQFVQTLQTADPALYVQLVGSFATYGRSAAAPVVGGLLGLLVAYLGLKDIVTPDLQGLLTNAIVGLGTALGAAAMHWYGKRPGRALQEAPPATSETIARVAAQ